MSQQPEDAWVVAARTLDELRAKLASISAEREALRDELDSYKLASGEALDEIAKLCGCPTWEYPGQVVRDVGMVVTARDAALAGVRRLTEQLAERDFLSAEQVRLIREREEVRAQLAALASHLAEIKRERDANIKRAAMFERMYDEALKRYMPAEAKDGAR